MRSSRSSSVCRPRCSGQAWCGPAMAPPSDRQFFMPSMNSGLREATCPAITSECPPGALVSAATTISTPLSSGRCKKGRARGVVSDDNRACLACPLDDQADITVIESGFGRRLDEQYVSIIKSGICQLTRSALAYVGPECCQAIVRQATRRNRPQESRGSCLARVLRARRQKWLPCPMQTAGRQLPREWRAGAPHFARPVCRYARSRTSPDRRVAGERSNLSSKAVRSTHPMRGLRYDDEAVRRHVVRFQYRTVRYQSFRYQTLAWAWASVMWLEQNRLARRPEIIGACACSIA